MWDKRLVHFRHKPVSENGLMRFNVTAPALFNPNFVESRTGLGVNGQGGFDTKTGYGWTGREWDRYLNYLDNMNVNGFQLAGANGENPYEVSPETVAFLRTTRPMLKKWGGRLWPSEADVEKMKAEANAAISPEVEKLYKNQGTWAALTGYRDYNDRLQRDMNAMYQNAMYMLNSGDPKLRRQGEALMNVVARGQYVFNEAQPKVTAQLQSKLNSVKDYAKNNWWWMVPGAALLLGGIGSLFGGGLAEDRQNGTAAVPGQPRTPLPDQWTTSLVPEMNGGLA